MTVSQQRNFHRRGQHKVKMPTLRSALHQDQEDQIEGELRQRHHSSQSIVSAQDPSSIDMHLNEISNIVTLTGSNPTSPIFDQQCSYLRFPKDQDLIDVLDDDGCYESEEGMLKRKDLISELDTLVKQWIRSVSLSKGFNWQIVEQVGGKIVTYGSFKLGVVGTTGDMDILCIAPQHIDRNDFFSSLFSQLRKRSKDITELRSLPDAFVPVIKMKFKGIEVDLTFASLYHREIPDDEKFLQSAAMSQLDPRCLRSLNGYRATAEILELVSDIPSFQVALRAVKLWAKRNGIYGNILGFPGGFSWTVLVAKVCQLNKDASPSELVYAFFLTWSTWPWPEPVFIRQPGPQPYQAWNPKVNPQDKSHCMPIITPSTPQINSTNLVTRSTLKCIHARLTRGLYICEDIRSGREPWNALFRAPCFFLEHEDFLLVTASCEGDQVLWFGLIESQLRHLKDNVEREYGVTAVHIWPTAFTREESIPIARMWFLGVEMQPGYDLGSIHQPLHLFQDQLLTKSHSFHSNYNVTMNVTVHHVTDREVTNYISEKEMELPEKKKLSYAAVTLGQTEDQQGNVPGLPVAPSQQQVEIKTSDANISDHLSAFHVSTDSLGSQSNNCSQKASATAGLGSEHSSAVGVLPEDLYSSTTASTSAIYHQSSHANITPAAVYQAALNNYANYLQPNFHQSYINQLSGAQSQNNHCVNSLIVGHPSYQNYTRSPSPKTSKSLAFSNPPQGFSTNQNSSPKPPFSSNTKLSHHVYNGNFKGVHSSPNFYNKECSETPVLHYSNSTPNLQMPVQNYLSAPPRYGQVNSSIHNHHLTPQQPPQAQARTNSPIHSQNQTPVNSPTVNGGHPSRGINSSLTSHNSFPSPISILTPTNIQVLQPNTNIPPPPLHSNPLVNVHMIDRSTPPPTLPMIDRSTPPPSLPPSPHYIVRLLPPNNNHHTLGLDCSCSDAESTTSRKDSCSDAEDKDRLRSVSNSSDKFPPSSLTRARVTHQEKNPISPMWGMVPLPERPLVPLSHLADTSVPPPSVTAPNSGSTPSFATAMMQPQRRRNNSRRLSQSEIRDTPVPRPVNMAFKHQNIRFSFNTDNVFK